MQLEMHELELRYASLRVLEPGRQARLSASLAREGQHSPVLVVVEDGAHVLIDGYCRVDALLSRLTDRTRWRGRPWTRPSADSASTTTTGACGPLCIACRPLDAVLAGIALFEGKRARSTLPEGVDGRYLRGIVVNMATEAESMAIADALLEERMRARDRALEGLERERERIHEDDDHDPAELVKHYAQRATATQRTLDRTWWLRSVADVVLDAEEHQRRPLLRLAARHISATHALPAKARNAAIRVLYAKAVPVA